MLEMLKMLSFRFNNINSSTARSGRFENRLQDVQKTKCYKDTLCVPLKDIKVTRDSQDDDA